MPNDGADAPRFAIGVGVTPGLAIRHTKLLDFNSIAVTRD